jgi:hypothetical protein
LNAETEKYAEQINCSVKDMVDDFENVLRRVKAFSGIRKTLKGPAFEEIIDNFKSSLGKALEFYGCMGIEWVFGQTKPEREYNMT